MKRLPRSRRSEAIVVGRPKLVIIDEDRDAVAELFSDLLVAALHGERGQLDEDDRLTERFADSLAERRQRYEERTMPKTITEQIEAAAARLVEEMRHAGMTCPVHSHVLLRCPACAGSKGGKSTSPRKQRAVRRNLKLANNRKEK